MGVNLLLIFFLFSFLLLSLSFIRLSFTLLGQLLHLFFPLCLGHIFDGLLLFFLLIPFSLLFLLPLFLYWWFCLMTLLGLLTLFLSYFDGISLLLLSLSPHLLYRPLLLFLAVVLMLGYFGLWHVEN